MNETKEKPKLKIVGTDGNVFAILGKAQRTAQKEGWNKTKIQEFLNEATSGDYNNALSTCGKYFQVE